MWVIGIPCASPNIVMINMMTFRIRMFFTTGGMFPKILFMMDNCSVLQLKLYSQFLSHLESLDVAHFETSDLSSSSFLLQKVIYFYGLLLQLIRIKSIHEPVLP